MRRFLPKSLTSQTILVLLLGLTVSHAISMVIYSSDRVTALMMLGGRNMAQRIANVAHLISDTPPDWRSRIIAAVNEPTFRVSLTPHSTLVPTETPGPQVAALKEFLARQLDIRSPKDLTVQLLEQPHEGGMVGMLSPDYGMHVQMMERMQGIGSHQSLRVSLALGDGQWLNFATDIPDTSSLWSTKSVLSTLAMALAVIVMSVWAVRRLTTPLRAFAEAAKRLGRDVNAPSLDEAGPVEVREAARAFNEMQDRLKRMIENRTQMMAAISHDLRTPITLLRLRTELLSDGDPDEQAKVLATLDEMEDMIASTLEFARQDAAREERRKVDLSALIGTICDDFADAGRDVTCLASEKVSYACGQVALKRLITNLIENALKYGERARVGLHREPGWVVVTVDDDGPGIEPDKLQDMFQPFVRGEASRSRRTGGVGLGLSVAQSIAHAHGGDIVLSNRDEGGLRAEVHLPV